MVGPNFKLTGIQNNASLIKMLRKQSFEIHFNLYNIGECKLFCEPVHS